MMKKLFFFLSLLILFCTSFFSMLVLAGGLDNFKLVAENQYLKLYLKEETTEIAVLDKASDKVWFSNPQNIDQVERKRRGKAKNMLKSQFILNYFTVKDEYKFMDTYNDSIQYKQYVINEIPNGIRIEYTLGKKWKDSDYLPIMISKERFDKLILSKIEDEDDRELLLNSYALLSLKEPDESLPEYTKVFGLDLISLSSTPEKRLFLGLDSEIDKKRTLIGRYLSTLISHRKDIKFVDDVTSKDVEKLKDNPTYVLLNDTVPVWDIDDIIKILKKIGLTPEEVQKDHIANHLDPPRPNIEVFKVAIEYSLEGDNLIVRIPSKEIKYPINVIDVNDDLVSFPVYSINLLEFFGAADNQGEGYMFVPDGSGALINLNSTKLHFPRYREHVYGEDHSIMPKLEKILVKEQIKLPVFGLKNGKQAFFAIIEDGESLANIKADIAGKTHCYNTVSSEFVIMPKGKIKLIKNEDEDEDEEGKLANDAINIFQSQIYQGDIVIRYAFLNGEDSNYVGMAKYYQDYLKEKYGLTRLNNTGNIPFYLELIGGIHKDTVVRGIPRKIIEPLTSYTQTEEIIDRLNQGGINNIKLKYTGWSKGGIEHIFPNKVSLEKSLGRSDDFFKLREFLQKKKIDFYPDLDFLYVYRNGWFDGFKPSKDVSRYLNRDIAKVYEYNRATYQKIVNNACYILSPNKLDSLVDDFLVDYQKYNIKGISLRHMGDQVNSDFREKTERLVDRQQAVQIIKEQLKKISSDYKIDILANGGNALILPYTKNILNIPLEDSGFDIIDQSIPFYQIVLHGYINYAGKPFNVKDNSYRDKILKALEFGELPYYRWSYQDSSALKNTEFDDLLTSCYKDWLDEAFNLYNELNTILVELQDQLIVDHKKLAEGVYLTEYENGKTIIVNYNNQSVKIADYRITGKDYLILKRGGK